jgi:segregation and condensation protein B
MKELPLENQIEAILFFKGEPVSKKKLSELLEVTAEEINTGLLALESSLSGRGLSLVHDKESVLLGTSPLASKLIEKVTKEELMRELGKAGLETLSIILYKQEVAKREVDYIRGVNSSFIIRNLLIRGLIERIDKGGRGYSYKPTVDLLAYLGISKIEDLPEYEKVMQEISEFDKKTNEADTETAND